MRIYLKGAQKTKENHKYTEIKKQYNYLRVIKNKPWDDLEVNDKEIKAIALTRLNIS